MNDLQGIYRLQINLLFLFREIENLTNDMDNLTLMLE